MAEVDMDAAPIPFDGDFFGDYPPEFFDDPDDAPASSDSSDEDDDDEEGPSLPSTERRAAVEKTAQRQTYVVSYPSSRAGAPIPNVVPTLPAHVIYRHSLEHGETSAATNIYYPFASRMEWCVAKWAKTRGPGSTSFSELLAIEDVAERLSLSFKNTRGLNYIIDRHLPPARPRFQREELVVAGEPQEVFFRDILQCVEALWGDPEFAPILLLVPERHYADADHTVHVYFDMNTGKWWWATQKELEREMPGATVIPIIISSDKTQLTQFGNKTAYPVYMTLGNLPKDVRCKPSRHGQILLAYLPTTRLLHITNKAARRRTLANLFHTAMSRILAPLASTGVSGIQLVSGDGIARRGHPILATYVGDYPEQVLVTGCKTGECPKCTIARAEVGASSEPSRPLRDLEKVLDALASIDDGPRAFTNACRNAGIKPLFHPFWEDLPYTNIFLAITPDILHQLYQGVIKHLLAWIQAAYGTDEIDARCRRMPLNNSLRHFTKGISHMSRIRGKEHQDISRLLLGLIIGLRLPDGQSPARLVRATRALLDFLYLAQYPTHTSETLALLEEHLQAFHENKSIFIDLGIRTNFEFPKLHSLDHYRRSIELFGTTDNYDTQYSERLHIDFAKDAYRASNKKEELVQMTVWLERKEKIFRHENAATSASLPSGSSSRIHMARHPSVKGANFDDIKTKYGATYFRDALTRYIVTVNHPDLTRPQVERQAASIYFPFQSVPVYNKVKIFIEDPDGLAAPGTGVRDVIHARATRQKKDVGGEISGRFDTALIRDHQDGARGSKPSFIVARVRVVFKIPERGMTHLFPGIAPDKRPQHLAYVELFTPLNTKHPDHGLYKVSPAYTGDGKRLGLIVPIDDIVRSCHLIPDFGPVAPRDWTSSNVLDKCTAFYLNTFADRNTYKLIF
ncbi:hypothetical protein LXA43DRAFT_976757 [Ganoderma leucocontextum]|nr:hypothetical protein LXA43DRAFT_976757 [Ganoderma leucocontextum]